VGRDPVLIPELFEVSSRINSFSVCLTKYLSTNY